MNSEPYVQRIERRTRNTAAGIHTNFRVLPCKLSPVFVSGYVNTARFLYFLSAVIEYVSWTSHILGTPCTRQTCRSYSMQELLTKFLAVFRGVQNKLVVLLSNPIIRFTGWCERQRVFLYIGFHDIYVWDENLAIVIEFQFTITGAPAQIEGRVLFGRHIIAMNKIHGAAYNWGRDAQKCEMRQTAKTKCRYVICRSISQKGPYLNPCDPLDF